MPSTTSLDICGRRRSPATQSDFHQGLPPRNKGLSYPADPPTVEEIIAVMRAAGDDADALRLRGLIIVLWRAGLRVSEALALTESDLDSSRGAILVCHAKAATARGRHGSLGMAAA
jgi:integrase